MTRSPSDLAKPRSYAPRWIGRALSDTWPGVREHMLLAALGVLGTAIALYLFAPGLLGPDSEELVSEELLLAVLAAVGSLGVVLIAVFIWSLLTAPAVMEQERLAVERARTAAVEAERDEARSELADLRDRTDRAKLRLEVVNDSDPLRPVSSSNAAMAEFIKSESHLFSGAYESYQPRPFETIGGEYRSSDEYTTEVRDYLTALSQRWDRTIAAAAVDRGVAELLLTVRNTGDVGYQDVAIEVTLPDGWNAAWDEGELWEEGLPERPELFGNKSVTFMAASATYNTVMSRAEALQPGTIRERDGGVIIRWNPFDLPSDRDHALEPVRLFIPDGHSGQTVALRWTAASVHGGRPTEGQMEIHVSATPAEPADLLIPAD